MNIETVLLSKYIVLKPYIDLMFTASDEVVLISLYNQAIRIYNESNSSALMLVRLMDKKSLGSVFNRSS